MSLRELQLKKWYSSATNNVLKEFYNPVLSTAVSYDRIAGFFSPSIFALAARGFSNGIKNNIKIRLITSIEVPDIVLESINDELNNDQFDNYVDWDLDSLTTELQKNYLKVFRNLLDNGQLEIRVAVLNTGGIMHQKIGIVYDENGDAISFSGSNNETLYGWSKNVEEFKVFQSWALSTNDYYENDKKQFDDLWNNRYENVKVVRISDAVRTNIVKSIQAEKTDDIIKAIKELEDNPGNAPTPEPQEDKIRPYQKEAIKYWKNNGYKAIFAMATGTGKTYTAARGLKEFFEDKGYLRAVIAVPLRTLADQWEDTLEELRLNVRIINTTNSDDWKNTIKRIENSYLFGDEKDFVIITTYANFGKITESSIGDDIIFIADEMHNLVTERGIKLSSDKKYIYKLGLSATPQRIWKKEESRIISKIFGEAKYEYNIDKALENGYLVPYDYYPEFVQLTPDEFESYVALTHEIAKMATSRPKDDSGIPADNNDILNMKRIARARIKKNAANKIPMLIKKLLELKDNGELDRALIYVDNENILSELQKELSDKRIITSRFLGETSDEDRKVIIKALCDKRIDAVVAIRCLDEGVDIPSAKMAFVLSNGTDPREYVQRLGRVLRLDEQNGKGYASVYDYFVLPPESTYYDDDFERNTARNIVKNEMRRTLFFSSLARNGDEVKEKIAMMQIRYGFFIDEDELENKEEGEYE